MWKSINTVNFCVSKKFAFSQTVAIFSLLGTLIDTKLNFLYDVLGKLKEITEKGASVIIYDSLKGYNMTNMKNAVEKIEKESGVPLAVFFSTKPNRFSKPFTGMWNIIEFLYKTQKKTINKDVSLYIGNRAGRLAESKRGRRDYGCADRAFAHNVGIKFATPEQFFNNSDRYTRWQWNTRVVSMNNRKFLLESQSKKQPVISEHIKALPNYGKLDFKCVVVIAGSPSCGKTTLLNKVKKKWDYDQRESCDSQTLEICETSTLDKYLKEGKSAIVESDAIYADVTKIVEIAMTNKAYILIVEIHTIPQMRLLLDFMKVQTSTKTSVELKPYTYWNTYNKQYKRLKYSDIPCVSYVEFPFVVKVCDAYWMQYSYATSRF